MSGLDLIFGDKTTGKNVGLTASGDCYQQMKTMVSSSLAAGHEVNVDRETLKKIEYVAGDFTPEERQKLGL